MPVFALDDALVFPAPRLAEPDGVLAVGGDLRPERLLLSYRNGIFPWPVEGYPLLWFSPDPRMVLDWPNLRVTRSLRKTLRRGTFEVTFDRDFSAVIGACSAIPRAHESGTWINGEVIAAYTRLHELGWAHSVETWLNGELVGGLYGVSIGRMFCGESMFHRVPDASKVAFATLARELDTWGFDFLDCQLHTPHLESLGAREVDRERYLERLARAVSGPDRLGPWHFDGPRRA